MVINRFGGSPSSCLCSGIKLEAAGGNVIAGNYIGTDVSGTTALGNTTGVVINAAANNTIGGVTAGARNVISSNNSFGIRISTGNAGNLVQGNYIGTDVSGTADLGNTFSGVLIDRAGNNTIGGATAGARNVVSGHDQYGVFIADELSTGNLVQGNYVGTDVNGTVALSNTLNGVIISGANNTIGGTTADARNVISGNGNGIVISLTSATGNLVQGNYIGTDVSGVADLGNTLSGVSIGNSANNTIGGTAAGARNVISGNNSHGIGISTGATGNQVQGNYIGTDVNGTAAIGNNADGVIILATANNTIGGTAASARNVISGNNVNGIEIGGSGATGNLVQGNYIGTDVNSSAALGNSQHGILISFGARSNTIGGTASGAGNVIAFNGGAGVFVESSVSDGIVSTSNAILSNSIHSNPRLGIDLGVNGITANDACDPDIGANNLQNFPVLTSASTTSIEGTINSTANTTLTLQFFANTSCDSAGNGEGQTFIGSTTVTTDDNCNASFAFPSSLSPGQVITATATDPGNNTSEFSQCLAVIVPTADLSVTRTDSPDPVIRGNNITYTVIVTNNGSSSAANASLSDAVPTNTKFVSNSGAADWSCTNPTTKGMATGTITCVKSILASGESATFTIVVQVKSGTKEGTIITNTATVSSSTSDPNTSNNSATTTTAVIRR
jgi:titin